MSSVIIVFFDFFYGRMAKRCPGAIALGGAVLLNHRLAERLYADIDFVSGATVEGVLYLMRQFQKSSKMPEKPCCDLKTERFR